MPASSPCSIAPGRSPPFTFRPSRKKPPAICCGVAKTFAPICCARGTGSRSSCCGTAAASRRTKKAWTKRHDAWLRAQTWPLPALDQTHQRLSARPSTKPWRASAPSRRSCAICSTLEPLRARVERLRCFRGIDDLTALTIAAELGDPRRFPTAPQHDGVRRPGALRALERHETRAGRDHQNRQCPSAPRARRSRLALSPSSLRRRARSGSGNAAHRPTVDCPRVDRAAAAASPLSAARRPRQTETAHRHRRGPRAHRLCLGGADPVI